MKKRLRTPADVEGELKFLENSLTRLRQSFILEKNDAVEQGGEALEHLRDREKCHYQPIVRRMMNDLRQLQYLSSRVEGVPTGIFHRLNELENSLKEARSHFTGSVNRLARCAWLKTGDDECTE